MAKNISLIDYLAYKVGATYISDLRYRERIPRFCLYREICDLEPEDFSLDEWTEALQYLAGCDESAATESAAKEALLRYL